MGQLKYVIECDGGEIDEPVFIAPDGSLCRNDSDAAWKFDDAVEAAREARKLLKRYGGMRLCVATIYG